jgi:hypothetical protein
MTTVLSCLYMWRNKVPDFPLGAKGIRGVLVVRGVSGFVSAALCFCSYNNSRPSTNAY